VTDARHATLDSPNPGLEQLLPRGLSDHIEVDYHQVPMLAIPDHCPVVAAPKSCPLSDLQCPLLGGNQDPVVLGARGEDCHQVAHPPLHHVAHQALSQFNTSTGTIQV
jgi:hypothetical protein